MKITMDGKYAFEGNPTKKVRILCVDGPGNWPVVGVRHDGLLIRRRIDGTCPGLPNLIPLQRRPREFWVNVYETWSHVHPTREQAKDAVGDDGETIHVREVLE